MDALIWTYVIDGLSVIVFGYFLVSNGFQTLLMCSAAAELRWHMRASWGLQPERMLGSRTTPVVSVLAPAYNEAATVRETVRSLLTLSYPNLEVVLVNDGSTDDTLELLEHEFSLFRIHPVFQAQMATERVRALYRSGHHGGLVVVDKENGGKSDALNAGLNLATGELVCSIDADTLIDPEAFLRIVRPFLRCPETLAAGATISIANGSLVRDGRVIDIRAPRHWLPGVQAVEYLRSFAIGRLGWNRLGGNLIVSGGFAMFRRDAVLAIGGYLRNTVGEDMELIARLHRVTPRHPHRVTFVPDPIAHTEAPESVTVLGRQRDRWQRGLAEVLTRHRGLLFNPNAGALGLIVTPYYLIVELFGPLIEMTGVLSLVLALVTGTVSMSFAVLFLLVAYGWGLILSLVALLLHATMSPQPPRPRDLAWLLAWAVLEAVGYRQLTVYWRVRGMVRYLQRRSDWGVMTRVGFHTLAPTEPSQPTRGPGPR